jgi:SAM-dependent methyltransferase
MRELIARLPSGAKVLDLGAASGSFPDRAGLAIVRLDLDPPHAPVSGSFVVADAARMPFRDAAFDLIVSNHSLEHFIALEDTVREIGRTIKPDGALFIAVPDASTLTDRIYRWLGRGGGHVNAFRSPHEVIALVERLTGLPHRATTDLYSSLSFLNNHNFAAPPPRRIALFAFGNEPFLALLIGFLRWTGRLFHTRLGLYGWAFRFGAAAAGPAPESWINVCVRCGSGHSEAYLRKSVPIRGRLLSRYRCPECRGFNFLTRE